MKNINKGNLESFLEYYHGLHDSYITNINYDISKSQIELLIKVFWSGKPALNENNTYETNKTKMKIIFEGVEKCNNKELFSWDYISDVYLSYIKLDNKEFLCFADEEEEPAIYIVCDTIKYEELK